MLNKIKSLLSGKTSTASDIRAALEALDDAPHLAAQAAAATRRAAALLEGSDADVLAAEDAANAARIGIDRNAAARDALGARLAEAEVAEAEAELRAQLAIAVAKRDDVVKRIGGDFAKGAKLIASVIEAARDSDATSAKLDADALARLGLRVPEPAAEVVWRSYYFSIPNLDRIGIPATKNSPALGSFARAPQALAPVLGA